MSGWTGYIPDNRALTNSLHTSDRLMYIERKSDEKIHARDCNIQELLNYIRILEDLVLKVAWCHPDARTLIAAHRERKMQELTSFSLVKKKGSE